MHLQLNWNYGHNVQRDLDNLLIEFFCISNTNIIISLMNEIRILMGPV